MSEAYRPQPGSLPRSLRALERVCREEGYTFTLIDAPSQQLVRIDHNGRHGFAGIGRVQNYPLNSATAASIARDKGFTYQTLTAAGIAVPPYGIFFLEETRRHLRGAGRERADAFVYAQSLGYPVFVKPLDGALGAFARRVSSEAALEEALSAIAARHHAALIQPVFDGDEWRLFLLNGEARFAYRRTPQTLRGDGRRTISELWNAYAAASDGLGRTVSPLDRAALAERHLSPDSVLGDAETLILPGAANLNAGGTLTGFTETPPPAWCAWGRSIMEALSLRVGAIDFFVKDRELIVLEVNHSPDLAGIIAAGQEACARAIWRDVFAAYFAEADAHA